MKGSKKQLRKLSKECRAYLQEWVGDKVNLENVVFHVHDGDYAVIVVAFIGYSINVYRLFTIGGEWQISVDNSISFDDLVNMVDDSEYCS